MCYFDDIIKFEDFDFHNTLLDKKSYESIFIYGVSNKAFIGAKIFLILFNNLDGSIRDYDETK